MSKTQSSGQVGIGVGTAFFLCPYCRRPLVVRTIIGALYCPPGKPTPEHWRALRSPLASFTKGVVNRQPLDKTALGNVGCAERNWSEVTIPDHLGARVNEVSGLDSCDHLAGPPIERTAIVDAAE